MNKLLLIASFSLLLVGCGEQTVKDIPLEDNTRFAGLNGNIKIITDRDTNCKYIYVEDGLGDHSTATLSPLYSSNGEVNCDNN